MEMIDITQQSALDEYLEKKISWTTFAQSTDFESGWGKTSPAYKRILVLVPKKSSSHLEPECTAIYHAKNR